MNFGGINIFFGFSSKKVVLLFCFFLVYNSIWSQSVIGIRGGLVSSCYQNKEPGNISTHFSSEPTYTFSILFKEREERLLNFTANINYLNRNVSIYLEKFGQTTYLNRDINLQLHSINLDLMPELSFGKKIRLEIATGFYFGLIVSSNKIETGWESFPVGPWETWYIDGSAKEDFSGFDFGSVSSIGLEIPIGNYLRIHGDINYSFGLNKIGNGTLRYVNSKNLYATLGISVLLPNFAFFDKLANVLTPSLPED